MGDIRPPDAKSRWVISPVAAATPVPGKMPEDGMAEPLRHLTGKIGHSGPLTVSRPNLCALPHQGQPPPGSAWRERPVIRVRRQPDRGESFPLRPSLPVGSPPRTSPLGCRGCPGASGCAAPRGQSGLGGARPDSAVDP